MKWKQKDGVVKRPDFIDVVISSVHATTRDEYKTTLQVYLKHSTDTYNYLDPRTARKVLDAKTQVGHTKLGLPSEKK